jgi:hypothetical protein
MDRASLFEEDYMDHSASQLIKSHLFIFRAFVSSLRWNLVNPKSLSQFETFVFCRISWLLNRDKTAPLTYQNKSWGLCNLQLLIDLENNGANSYKLSNAPTYQSRIKTELASGFTFFLFWKSWSSQLQWSITRHNSPEKWQLLKLTSIYPSQLTWEEKGRGENWSHRFCSASCMWFVHPEIPLGSIMCKVSIHVYMSWIPSIHNISCASPTTQKIKWDLILYQYFFGWIEQWGPMAENRASGLITLNPTFPSWLLTLLSQIMLNISFAPCFGAMWHVIENWQRRAYIRRHLPLSPIRNGSKSGFPSFSSSSTDEGPGAMMLTRGKWQC